MRLGTAKNFRHSTPEEWAKIHHDLGLRAVVFPLDNRDDPALADEYAAAAKHYDIAIAEAGIWLPLVCADEEQRKANIDYAVREMKFADRIGARCCVDFIGTYNGVRTEDSPLNFTDEAFEAAVKTIKEIINLSEPKTTKFALEAMRNSLPISPEQYLELLNEIGDDGFGVHLDPFNWALDASMLPSSADILDRSFDLLGGKIVSCHLKDLVADGEGVAEVMPTKGVFDIAHFFDRLKEYPDTPVIIEHLNSTEEYLEALSLIDAKFGIMNL